MTRMKFKKRYVILVLFFFLLLASILLLENFSDKNLIKKEVTVRLKWITQAQFAGYFVALEKGFYEEENLIVSINEGVYGKNPLKTVKNEVEEFGVLWASDIVGDSENFISLANILKDNGFLLISKKNKGIDSISKFKNKKISTWFIGHEYQLKSLLSKKGLVEQAKRIISQKWDLTQFYNNEVDVVSAMSYNELLTVFENGYPRKKLNIFNLRSNGVGFPGQNIFTTRSFYKNHPDVCRGFVKASIKGWEYAINNPNKAVEILLKYDYENKLDKKHQYNQMIEIIKLIKADKFQIGIHNRSDYEYIKKVFMENRIVNENLNVESLYTNEFVE